MEVRQMKELSFGVGTRLETSFRSGATEAIAMDEYLTDFHREVDLGAMNLVVDEAMNRFEREQRARSDSWLGPRLHHALRLTRQEAARRGVWLFLAIAARPDYVVWRWAGTDNEEPAG